MTLLSDFYKFFNTADATAVAADIKSGKTAFGPGGKVTGALIPSLSLLLYHQFDGVNGASISGVKPEICYDDTTNFIGSGSPLPTLNGSGYLVGEANNNQVIIDPDTRWPSRVGKIRIYEFWGRYAAAPASTSDYMPQARINYVDDSNFWVARGGHGSNSIYNMQYEWLAAAVGEIRSSGTLTGLSGAFSWLMRIEDQGDQVLTHLRTQRESTVASDLTIVEPGSVQLHKVSRPNQSEARFSFRWESVANYANCQLRGLMVYDR